MKKTFLCVLLCCSSLIFAQDIEMGQTEILPSFPIVLSNKLLAATDFKMLDGRMIVTEIPCEISSGSSIHQFIVSVVCMQNAFNETGLAKINEIILLANDKARATIAPDFNYWPTEIKMSYNPMIKDWCLTHLFSFKDKDGNTNSKLLAMDFDATGKFLVMKKVF